MVLRQVMLQHLRAVLEEAARKTSPSQMRRVCREPKAEAPRSEEMCKDGSAQRAVAHSVNSRMAASMMDARRVSSVLVNKIPPPILAQLRAGQSPAGAGGGDGVSAPCLLITPQRRRSWQAAPAPVHHAAQPPREAAGRQRRGAAVGGVRGRGPP